MATFIVEHSRGIAIEPDRAFDATLPMPLTAIFSRRYGLLPPVKEVRGPEGKWGQVGQSRVVVTADGGTMRELLTEVDFPNSFSYVLSEISGPMKPLVDRIEGRWEFAPHDTGTLITWQWTLHAKFLGACVMPLITLMWRGYARQSLELLSQQLLAANST